MTTKTKFNSGDSFCTSWLTLPTGKKPFPVIILVHGGGATHDMMLEQYEREFSNEGYAVLSFDFRHLGESGGNPRQYLNISRYLEDIDSAIKFVKEIPELDPTRIALWGTSLGSSHVVASAAKHPELKAAIIQCPVLQGRAPALKSGLTNLLRLTFPILSDTFRSFFQLERRYVPIVGLPGEKAFVTVAGALEGWRSVMPEGYKFDNRITAGSAIGMLFYDAYKYAKRVKCPLLVCVSDKETLMDPKIAVRCANEAPLGKAIHYPADHFDVYHSPLFEKLIRDQIEFLDQHMK